MNKRDIISLIVITLLILFSVNQCSKAKTNENVYKSNLKAVNDSVSYYKNRYGQEVALKTNIIAQSTNELKEALKENKQLKEAVKRFKKLDVVAEVQTVTQIKEVIIPKTDTIHDTFFPEFAKETEHFSIHAKSTQEGLELINLQIPNKQSVVVGSYKPSFFGKSQMSTIVTNSNPYIKVNDIQTYQVKVPKKWYEKPFITIPLGVAAGLLIK